jgi:hypothetical protein
VIHAVSVRSAATSTADADVSACALLSTLMLPSDLRPQLVGNEGLRALRAAIAEPRRYAIEPKVDASTTRWSCRLSWSPRNPLPST